MCALRLRPRIAPAVLVILARRESEALVRRVEVQSQRQLPTEWLGAERSERMSNTRRHHNQGPRLPTTT